MTDVEDRAYMNLAFSLAEKALGRASPNPYVGAVIVNRGVIVGHGYHEGVGRPHAEIVALRRAGSKAAKGTLYVTLEPCIHWGRTPPCTEAILAAGLKRIAVAALDPNPLVCRKGIRKLREAGLKVTTGILEERNARLNEFYAKYITRKIPYVTLKAALSLDGKMATRTFDARWITSAEAREYAQLVRGEYDAIMIGINTVLRDDPLLTVRHPNWKHKKIVRVLIDARFRTPLNARILSTLRHGPILVFTGAAPDARKKRAFSKRGAEVISMREKSGRIDIGDVVSELGRREIASVLIEGGGRLATTVLEEKLADKALLMFSPRLVGGSEAVSFFGGKGVAALKDSLVLKSLSSFRLGNDLVLEGYF
jgi:diaminohydroxyphosphoribosylaminopyrimidine deaminase/5-amino-6-(5-phosphoribosylamino)uracil reductase